MLEIERETMSEIEKKMYLSKISKIETNRLIDLEREKT